MPIGSKHSRIELKCKISGQTLLIWVDTGSPNTLVHVDFAKRFGLQANQGWLYSGKIAGAEFRGKSSVTIPEIILPECLPLKNIRVIAALEDAYWENIIILGLNVLNHLTYKINRDPMPGSFEWLESLTSSVPNSERARFDHIIWEGKYLLTD